LRRIESLCERFAQRRAPVTFKGEKSTYDERQRLRWIDTSSVRDGQAGTVKAAYALHLLLGVPNLLKVDGLLRLENRVHALGRDNLLPLKIENEWRILTVEHDHIDLLAETPGTVHHSRSFGAVASREIGLQHLEPYGLAGITLQDGVP
jgi:hypothetical protein